MKSSIVCWPMRLSGSLWGGRPMTPPDTNITSLADSEHAYSTEAPDINVTSAGSPDKRAMTGAERARLHRQRQKGERLHYTSDEWRAFVDPAGLARKAGA